MKADTAVSVHPVTTTLNPLSAQLAVVDIIAGEGCVVRVVESERVQL